MAARGRPSLMPDQKGRVCQTGAVMAGDAMKEDGLPARDQPADQRPRPSGRASRSDPRIGTITQLTPVWLTTFACSTYLRSSRLIAVSVTIVLIRSRAMIARKAAGTSPGTPNQAAWDDDSQVFFSVAVPPESAESGPNEHSRSDSAQSAQ